MANSPQQKSQPELEMTIYLAEYAALSVVQQNAKSTLLQILTLYHSGLLASVALLLSPQSNFPHQPRQLLFLFYGVSVLNAFLLFGCGHQLFSFFSVSGYFQLLRQRLMEIAGSLALGYEANLGKFIIDGKQEKFGLGSWAFVCWFSLPILICCATLATPFLFWRQYDVRLTAAFVVSVAYSIGALTYLIKLCLWISKLEPIPIKET